MKLRRVVVEQIDVDKLAPGGIDTCIRDLIVFGQEYVHIVGVTNDASLKLGGTYERAFDGVPFLFTPVARLNREAKTAVRLPHSLVLMLGVLRFARRVPDGLLQAHRVETGVLLSLMFGRRPFAQFIHNNAVGLTSSGSDSLWRRFGSVYRMLERRVLRRAHSVVLFNRVDAPRVRTRRPDLIVSRTWYNDRLFSSNARPRRVSGSDLRAVVVGRIEAQKDPVLCARVLIEASRSVNIDVSFAGSGSMIPVVADLLGAAPNVNVEFMGSISRERVADLLARSDVMLLTSHYEGSPRVVWESLASGVPVVATSEADPDDVLDGVTNGVSVPGRSSEVLAAELVSCLRFSAAGCVSSAAGSAATVRVPALLDLSRTGSRSGVAS